MHGPVLPDRLGFEPAPVGEPLDCVERAELVTEAGSAPDPLNQIRSGDDDVHVEQAELA